MNKKHGGNIYGKYVDFLDFSANINPLGMPDAAKKAFFNSFHNLTKYPDTSLTELRHSISEYEFFNADGIVCGNGASDIIYRLVYVLRPQRALLPSPTFLGYEDALLNIDCDISYYNLSENLEFNLQEDFLNYTDYDIVFLCNPNNPTGKLINPEFILTFAKNNPKTYVIVDECFMDFVINNDKFSVRRYLNECKNLIILKAFTKFFAMPGLRLGYTMLNDSDLIKKLLKANQPWSVSIPASECAIAAVRDIRYIENTRTLISNERTYIENELVKLNFKIFKSQCNFILFKTGLAPNLIKFLKSEKILVRSCENFKSLNPDFIRIAVKSHEDNLKLITVLRRFING